METALNSKKSLKDTRKWETEEKQKIKFIKQSLFEKNPLKQGEEPFPPGIFLEQLQGTEEFLPLPLSSPVDPTMPTTLLQGPTIGLLLRQIAVKNKQPQIGLAGK